MQFDYRYEGGESASQFEGRVVGLLAEINNKHNDFEALIIAHGGVLRLLHLLDRSEENHGELDHATLLSFDVDKILANKRTFES